MIRINCPSCTDSFCVHDNLAGKSIKCRNCQKLYRVPLSSYTSGWDAVYGKAMIVTKISLILMGILVAICWMFSLPTPAVWLREARLHSFPPSSRSVKHTPIRVNTEKLTKEWNRSLQREADWWNQEGQFQNWEDPQSKNENPRALFNPTDIEETLWWTKNRKDKYIKVRDVDKNSLQLESLKEKMNRENLMIVERYKEVVWPFEVERVFPTSYDFTRMFGVKGMIVSIRPKISEIPHRDVHSLIGWGIDLHQSSPLINLFLVVDKNISKEIAFALKVGQVLTIRAVLRNVGMYASNDGTTEIELSDLRLD